MSENTVEFDVLAPEGLELTQAEENDLKNKFRAALVEVFEARNEGQLDPVVGDIELVPR
jgi:hypothetical protein